ELLGIEDRLRFEAGDATNLAFHDECADVVFALECVFHFPSRRSFLTEAFRVLRPGGRLIVADLYRNLRSTVEHPVKVVRRIIHRRVAHIPQCNVHDEAEYRRVLAEIGYRSVEITSIAKDVLRPFAKVFPLLTSNSGETISTELMNRLREIEVCDARDL